MASIIILLTTLLVIFILWYYGYHTTHFHKDFFVVWIEIFLLVILGAWLSVFLVPFGFLSGVILDAVIGIERNSDKDRSTGS